MERNVIGIDIGGTNTAIGLVNSSGELLASSTLSTRAFPKAEDFVVAVAQECKRISLPFQSASQLCATGIGAPNGNYYTGRIEQAPNLRWKGAVSLAGMMREAMGLPSVLTNDANAAAMGEMLYGGAVGMKNFIVVTIGTGLGSGIVVNGEILYGHTGFAGELGHTIAVHGGRLCGCGRQGCLETYVSARGLRQTVQELLAESDQPSILRDLPADRFNARAVHEAAERGDEIALRAFQITGGILGRHLADAVAYVSPEAIFLFGGVANAGEYLMRPTREAMDAALLNIFQGTVRLLPSSLHNRNAAILGAAALAWKEFCNN